MRAVRVAVLGAGSLRCGPHVASALAQWKPDDLVDIFLWDANEERLDLFDRLLRRFLDVADTRHTVTSSSEDFDILRSSGAVIASLHEDCCRRLLGLRRAALFTHEEPFLTGDPNKPTPPDKLSLSSQNILSIPVDPYTAREDTLKLARDKLSSLLDPNARILNLTRGMDWPGSMSLNWPKALDGQESEILPHQVLRWIQGSEPATEILELGLSSPVCEWLKNLESA